MQTAWEPIVSETVAAPFWDQLRQGDILELSPHDRQTNDHSIGIVINADCDLAHGKLDGVVAYLPVYTLQQYTELFWGPEQFIPQHKDAHLEWLKRELELSKHETDELVARLPEIGPDAMSDLLQSACDIDDRRIASIKNKLHGLALLLSDDSSCFGKIIEFARREKKPEIFLRKLMQAATTEASLGGAHFFLSEISGIDALGFIIRLRRIYSVPADNCTPVTPETTKAEHIYRRLCRLSEPYKYKIAQKFAFQFSRIGLPDDLIGNRATALEFFIEEHLP